MKNRNNNVAVKREMVCWFPATKKKKKTDKAPKVPIAATIDAQRTLCRSSRCSLFFFDYATAAAAAGNERKRAGEAGKLEPIEPDLTMANKIKRSTA